MVQNIHPLGINTLFLPSLVLRFIVRPSRLFMSLYGRDITKSSAFRSLVSLLEVTFCDNAEEESTTL